VVTSPPYFGLRSYQDGGQHYPGQIGSEATPAEWVEAMLAATREMVRVLKPSGSVRRSHETWFHFTVQPRYYSAVDEIREPHTPGTRNAKGDRHDYQWNRDAAGLTRQWEPEGARAYNPLGKLPGSVWSIPSQPLTVPPELGVQHFAAFPMEWPRRLIAGWSPAGICSGCGEGRRPVKGVDWSKVPHRMVEKRALTTAETAGWCAEFADWCESAGVTRAMLDAAAGTSDMGGWWASRLAHRAQAPTPEQWMKIQARFAPPPRFDSLVHLTRLVAVADRAMQDVTLAGRNRATGGGLGEPVMSITGYVCACPDPTAPTTPAVVLDGFGGTGTVAMVAHVMGRHGISVDLSSDYCRLAAWRTTDPAQLAQAAQVDKPPTQTTGQDALFEVIG
jgi:hypothetical protein